MTCRRTTCQKSAHTRGFCESHYRYMLHTGRFGYTDATPARQRVLLLREWGWTYQQIADAAGTASWTPHQLARGSLTRLLPETSKGILAIDPVPAHTHRGVDGTGTYRRVEGLQWMGWPMWEIARRVGVKPYTLTTLRSRQEPVSYRVARAVKDVYDELGGKQGPSLQSATKAKRRGYVSPMAWDDETIDDPDVQPDLGEHDSRRSPLPPGDELRFLLSCGESIPGIASRFGVGERTVQLALREVAA